VILQLGLWGEAGNSSQQKKQLVAKFYTGPRDLGGEGSFEHGYEFRASIKGGKFLDCLNDCCFLEKYFAPC
jgi:hypothetical protein